MTVSATDTNSIDPRWFMGGRFEKTIQGHPISYYGDLRIVALKGLTPWTRKLMLAMMNVRGMRDGDYMDCAQPFHPEMLRLRHYGVEILPGNCAVLTSKDGQTRFTLFPFNQNPSMLNDKFGMAEQ